MKSAKEIVTNILKDELDVITTGKVESIAERIVKELQLTNVSFADTSKIGPSVALSAPKKEQV